MEKYTELIQVIKVLIESDGFTRLAWLIISVVLIWRFPEIIRALGELIRIVLEAAR